MRGVVGEGRCDVWLYPALLGVIENLPMNVALPYVHRDAKSPLLRFPLLGMLAKEIVDWKEQGQQSFASKAFRATLHEDVWSTLLRSLARLDYQKVEPLYLSGSQWIILSRGNWRFVDFEKIRPKILGEDDLLAHLERLALDFDGRQRRGEDVDLESLDEKLVEEMLSLWSGVNQEPACVIQKANLFNQLNEHRCKLMKARTGDLLADLDGDFSPKFVNFDSTSRTRRWDLSAQVGREPSQGFACKEFAKVMKDMFIKNIKPEELQYMPYWATSSRLVNERMPFITNLATDVEANGSVRVDRGVLGDVLRAVELLDASPFVAFCRRNGDVLILNRTRWIYVKPSHGEYQTSGLSLQNLRFGYCFEKKCLKDFLDQVWEDLETKREFWPLKEFGVMNVYWRVINDRLAYHAVRKRGSKPRDAEVNAERFALKASDRVSTLLLTKSIPPMEPGTETAYPELLKAALTEAIREANVHYYRMRKEPPPVSALNVCPVVFESEPEGNICLLNPQVLHRLDQTVEDLKRLIRLPVAGSQEPLRSQSLPSSSRTGDVVFCPNSKTHGNRGRARHITKKAPKKLDLFRHCPFVVVLLADGQSIAFNSKAESSVSPHELHFVSEGGPGLEAVAPDFCTQDEGRKFGELLERGVRLIKNSYFRQPTVPNNPRFHFASGLLQIWWKCHVRGPRMSPSGRQQRALQTFDNLATLLLSKNVPNPNAVANQAAYPAHFKQVMLAALTQIHRCRADFLPPESVSEPPLTESVICPVLIESAPTDANADVAWMNLSVIRHAKELTQEAVRHSRQMDGPGSVDFSPQTDGPGPLDYSPQTDGPGPLDYSRQTDGPGPLDFSRQTDGPGPVDFSRQTDGPGPVDYSRQTDGPAPVDFSRQTKSAVRCLPLKKRPYEFVDEECSSSVDAKKIQLQ